MQHTFCMTTPCSYYSYSVPFPALQFSLVRILRLTAELSCNSKRFRRLSYTLWIYLERFSLFLFYLWAEYLRSEVVWYLRLRKLSYLGAWYFVKDFIAPYLTVVYASYGKKTGCIHHFNIYNLNFAFLFLYCQWFWCKYSINLTSYAITVYRQVTQTFYNFV